VIAPALAAPALVAPALAARHSVAVWRPRLLAGACAALSAVVMRWLAGQQTVAAE